YLAVRGGLNTPPLYGSRSTHARAGMGGHKGRNLIDGDLLPLVASNADVKPMYLPAKQVKSLLTKMFEVSVVMGPQDDAFSVAEIKRFLTSTYQVGRNTDRMGMRLQGPVLEHESSADILSDGIAPGSVQVPGSGLPIVLLAERQTIGGYTKIATVVSCELGRLSQLLSGAEFKFNKVSPEEAISMTRRKHKEMTELISSICVQPTSVILSDLMTNNLVSGVVDANSSCEK
ncbi:MAG: biotin-dependent carboxyltransferase family protein, partial [Alphaproteobacteria bacterium]